MVIERTKNQQTKRPAVFKSIRLGGIASQGNISIFLKRTKVFISRHCETIKLGVCKNDFEIETACTTACYVLQ